MVACSPRGVEPKQFPSSMMGALDYVRWLSLRHTMSKRLADRHLPLRPAERIRRIYPLGVEAGVMAAFEAGAKAGIALPAAIDRPTSAAATAYARGMAIAAVLPPKAAFGQAPPKAIRGIWHAGFEWGALRTLEQMLGRTTGRAGR